MLNLFLVVDQVLYAQRHFALMIKVLKRVMGEKNQFFPSTILCKTQTPQAKVERQGCQKGNLHVILVKENILCQGISLIM